MSKIAFTLIAWFFLHSVVNAEIVTEQISYQQGDVSFTGYFAYDDDFPEAQQRPAVIVVHEWWGHNDYARRRARDIAELGYVGFALDMYGDGKVATHPEEAKAFMGEVVSNLPLMQSRFALALDLLKQDPRVDDNKIAAIGYCFGGGVVLNMARTGIDLKGVASFHGALNPAMDVQPGQIKAPLIVFHGELDSFVSMEQLHTFESQMQEAGADLQVVTYPDAEHGFTNSDADEMGEEFGLPISYDPDADQDSWDKLVRFLHNSFAD